MSLITYNFLWGIIKYFLPKYLERRQKKGKEDSKRINERFGVSRKERPEGTIIWLHGTSVGESVAALALANSMTQNSNDQLQDLQSQYWKASDNLRETKFASRWEQIEAIRKLSQLGLALDASATVCKINSIIKSNVK